ncbi:hypothetical protein M3090_01510 [Bacteroides sp. ET71]|uniref:hypothetical protein n=1 Tax=Bacteroides sp. ET71 TaxID=2939421 RepID=UPI0020132D11|nr:hypothetical protein [Bacteroides sp. ET71]MCL1615088.1 hypothetical protein [Bacteroides sp. ET71]
MKKIMFSDEFLLTQAVLDGRKTQTRRLLTLTLHKKADRGNALIEVSPSKVFFEDGKWKFVYDDYVFLLPKGNYPKYRVGEVVAVAQSYCSIADELENCNNATCAAHYEKNVQKASEYISWMEHPGFNNKMFVASDKMLHQIRITDVRVEKLQEISDDDCLKEGVVVNEPKIKGGINMYYPCEYLRSCAKEVGWGRVFHTPREAFAHLINKVSRKDVWNENPYVFVYDFELVK